jgi:hypothetical protein
LTLELLDRVVASRATSRRIIIVFIVIDSYGSLLLLLWRVSLKARDKVVARPAV